MEKVKKARKKKSLSAQLKDMRKDRDRWSENYWHLHRQLLENIYICDRYIKILPQKYFKISFKIKSNDGFLIEKTEVSKGVDLDFAIEFLKSSKTHPETFELIDAKVLG